MSWEAERNDQQCTRCGKMIWATKYRKLCSRCSAELNYLRMKAKREAEKKAATADHGKSCNPEQPAA